HAPRLFFLDIHMPGVNGLEAARAIGRRSHVVFVTAYDQYAVEAFEQGVVDYVLKPAERERLAVTVERLRRRIRERGAAGADAPPLAAHTPDLQQLLQTLALQLNPAAPPKLRWIQASVGQQIQMIPVEDVLFFISDEKYTRVQTATLEALIRKPIKELVEELDMTMFWQIHRSTLVNTRHIAAVSRDLRGRQLVSVKGHPAKLEVSRSFSGLFKGM
ncbi:MAG TPA: LytTR family DNA-binding domain-containing protein, partial [Albitalea sp.]